MKKFFRRIMMSFRMRLFGISVTTIKDGDLIVVRTGIDPKNMTVSMLRPMMDDFKKWFERNNLHGCKLYFFAKGESIEILRPGELDEKETNKEINKETEKAKA